MGMQGMGMNPMMNQGMGGMQGGMQGGMNMNPMMMNPAMLPQGMHGQMGEAQALPVSRLFFSPFPPLPIPHPLLPSLFHPHPLGRPG
jgi:hypothetical protein